MLDESLRLNGLVPLVLRIALAAVFIYHGLDKVAGKDPVTQKSNDMGTLWAENFWLREARPPQGVEAKLDQLVKDDKLKESEAKKVKENLAAAYSNAGRTSPADAMPGFIAFAGTQMAVAWGELICGVSLLLGLLTRLSAVLMMVIQAGAIFTVTWAQGFSMATGAGY